MHSILGLVSGPGLWALLVESVLKGTLVLAAGSLLVFVSRRASAAWRHLVWTLALGALVALPLLLAALPAWQVVPATVSWMTPAANPPVLREDALRPATEATTAARPAEVVLAPSGPVAESPAADVVLSSSPSAARRAPWFDVRRLAVVLWGVGAGLVLATFAAGHVVLRALLRRARVVQDGEWHGLALEAADRLRLTQPFALLQGPGVPVPVAFGLLRSRVLLPPEADTWPIERRRSVLLHELAHVQRHDCLTQALAQVACALFWFHPLVWWAAGRLRAERERACDDRVLAARTAASDYADHLLDVVRSLRATRLAALGAVAFARPSSLEGRLIAVLDPTRDRRPVDARAALPALGLAAILVMPLAAMEPAHVQAGVIHTEGHGNFSGLELKSQPPSTVLKRTATDAALDDHVAWARKEAGKLGRDVWWIGWRAPAGHRETGGFLSDTDGIDLDMLGKLGLLTLDDVLEDRAQGTSRPIAKGVHPAAFLVRMDHGVPNRVRIQSLDMPAEFAGQPLFWFENVTTEQSFAWLRREAEHARGEEVRARLVESVGYLDRTDLTEPFLRAMLEGDDTKEVRKYAVKALGHDPSAESLRLLRTHARTDPSAEVRRAAVEALGWHQTPEALAALLDLAGADSDREVRRAAFDAMGEKIAEPRGDEAAVRAEADAVREEADAVRADADQRKGHEEKAVRMAEPAGWDEPSAPMNAADLDVQRQAIESLGHYPEAQSLPRLKRLAESAPNQDLRMQAVESIGRLGTKASDAVIEEVLWRNRMEGARSAAVEQIARRVPEDEALDRLEKVALSHPSVQTRRMAVEQIGRLGGARSRQVLLRTIHSAADLDCQMQAVESLGRRKGSDVTDQLLEIVNTHPAVDVRRAAVEALGKREDDGDNVERLAAIARAKGPDDVRRQAVESLGRLADSRVKGLLLDLVKNAGSVDVQRQAVESLGRLEGDDVMADLADLARTHPLGDVRRQAVESMTRRDPDKALPMIEDILKQQTKRKGTL